MREVARDLSLLDKTNLSAKIVAHIRANISRDVLLVFDDIGPDFPSESCEPEFGKPVRSPGSSTIIVQCVREENLEAVIEHSLKSEDASLKVSALHPVEAKVLLRAQCVNGWDEKAAENVVKELDMSVLALTLATAYIEENKITLAGYMQRLEAIIGNVPGSSAVPRSIWLALRLSITQIKKEKPRAFEMLSLVSLIDRQSVNEGFLASEREKARSFYGAIRLLKALTLLLPGRHRASYFIHRYTQLFMLEELEEDGLLQFEKQQSVKWTAQRYPQGEQSNWLNCEMLLPHAYKILKYSMKDQNEALLLKKVAEYYRFQGQYDASFKLYDRARAIYSSKPQVSTKWQEERLDLDIKAAQALCGSSQYAKAEAILKQTLESTKAVLRVDHPCLIKVNSTLALIYESQGHYQLAADMYRTALKANIKLHYENHVGSLTLKSNISVALVQLGQYAEAEKLQIEAIEGRIWLRGAEHPDTIQSIANLAALLQHQSRYLEAAEMNEEILEVSDRVQGLEHSDTLNIVNNLSINLRSLGRYFEAETMQRRLLDASVRQLGTEHQGAIKARLNLATTLEKLGKYPEAEKEVRAALESNKKIFPDSTHPTTLNSLNTLGLLLLRQGSFAEAEPILRDGLEATKANFQKTGGNYRPVLVSKNNYAGTLLRRQKYEASKKLFDETLDGAREHLGEEDPFTLRVMNSLSQVLREGVTVLGTEEQQLDVLQEAETLQRTALAGRTKVCGSEHPDTLTSMYQLGRVLQDLERYGEARELYEKSLAGFEVKLGSEHETTKECRKHLALLLNPQG